MKFICAIILQTTVYYRGKLHEFSSSRLRQSMSRAEDDSVILFLRRFFPQESKHWLHHHIGHMVELTSVLLHEVESAEEESEEEEEEVDDVLEDEADYSPEWSWYD